MPLESVVDSIIINKIIREKKKKAALTEGAVELEGFRDLATGESSEAAHDGFLGELEVLLG